MTGMTSVTGCSTRFYTWKLSGDSCQTCHTCLFTPRIESRIYILKHINDHFQWKKTQIPSFPMKKTINKLNILKKKLDNSNEIYGWKLQEY